MMVPIVIITPGPAAIIPNQVIIILGPTIIINHLIRIIRLQVTLDQALDIVAHHQALHFQEEVACHLDLAHLEVANLGDKL